KTFSQFSRKCFKFLFVHNLPVSVVGVKISKTGNYTILFTVSDDPFQRKHPVSLPLTRWE
ncbi:hypothetical protein C6P89_22325, partial [Yersinia pestis]